MGKKTANNAIDFSRLFAMKDQLARRPQVEDRESGIVAIGHELEESVATNETVIAPESATEISLVTEPTIAPTPESEQLIMPATTPSVAVAAPVATTPSTTDATFLRVGMSRAMHERVRAFAALQGEPSTRLVRDLFERVTPVFDATSPMATLASIARGAVPAATRERRVEVRMQVPVSEDLHRRMQKFAALRTQTLGACMLDVLDAHAPSL